VNRRQLREAEFVSAVSAIPQTCLLHDDLQTRPAAASMCRTPSRTADGGPTKV
jgi:hypothetical protein